MYSSFAEGELTKIIEQELSIFVLILESDWEALYMPSLQVVRMKNENVQAVGQSWESGGSRVPNKMSKGAKKFEREEHLFEYMI